MCKRTVSEMPEPRLSHLSPLETEIVARLSQCSPARRKALVVVVLAVAALCMVLAWIYHLRKHDLTFWAAFALSLAFVIPEFLLNTWITRLSYHTDLFRPGQLAMISIVTGVIWIALLAVTVFGARNALSGTTVLGFLLVAGGAVLLLYDKKF